MVVESMSFAKNEAMSGRLKVEVGSNTLKLLAALLVALATVAILSTARVFSGTVDEPAHIAAGMQWLTTDRYDYDLQHPPIGRVAAALGPYLSGARGINAQGVYDEGAAILGTGTQYVDRLASARYGEIIFFVALALVVWAWSRRLLSEVGAIVATLYLVTNPTVLAHAGLATTDIACAATTMLALFAATWWIEQPTWVRSALFGAAIGAAIGSRLSAIAFVGGPLVVCYILRGIAERTWTFGGSAKRSGLAALGLAAAMMFVIWAAYRFDAGPFIAGVERFLLHGSSGHPTFLLGTPSNRGWWYYFPVALLVKTPAPVLIATLLGAAATISVWKKRRDWRAAVPFASAMTILAISLTVKVDLGVRLVLPMYPLMAIVGAQGFAYLLREHASRTTQAFAAAMLVWTIVTPIRSHPDHLAYFNALAGDHPENVLVDSNLDWGQDLYRLRDTIVARGITDTVRVAYFGTADLTAAGVPSARLLGLHERATGWVAASETFLAGEWVGRAYAWLLDYPETARIGPSMRLWYIAPDSATRGSSPR
jgi:hypothetical protein